MAVVGHSGSVIAQTNQISSASVERDRTLVVGRISDNPKKHFSRLEIMADYLAQRLGDSGIDAGRVVMAKDKEHMARLLREGQVDIFSETPFTAVQLADTTAAKMLAREWAKGVASYRTVFFTHKENSIASIADLRGRKIAFEDPDSTSAFLIPLAMIRMSGLETVELMNVRDEVPDDKVGYAFTRNELNMVSWVARRITDVGAFSNLDWEDLARTPEKPKNTLRVFHESEPIMRSLLMARGNLRPEIMAELKEILFSMHSNPEGIKVLKAYNEVKKFDAIEVEEDSLDEVRRLMSFLMEELRQ